MTDRAKLKSKFLADNKLSESMLTELHADASFRKYYRVNTGKDSLILMDAPPAMENSKQFVKVAEFLKNHKFSVPNIISADTKCGFLLLEDFGDNKFTTILDGANNTGLQEVEIYKLAVDLLVELQTSTPPADQVVPYFSDDTFIEGAELFLTWYVNKLSGKTISKKIQDEYNVIWKHLLQYARYIPETTMLRDFHADNLMWLQGRSGTNQIGLLDFQDASIGSPLYDLVSLLEDARPDVPKDVVNESIKYYLSKRTDITLREFRTSYAVIAAQRNLRIAGIFARKALRDNNNNYLKYLPRVFGYIENNLKNPLLIPLKAWMDKVVKPDMQNIQQLMQKANA